MRMLRPFRRSAFFRHDRAMHAPSQTAAASSNVMPAGLCAKGALSRMHTYSACAPKPVTPKTWSPTRNSVTAAPAPFTSPASSMPRILRLGRSRPVATRLMKTSALRSPQSVRVTVVAWTLMRTSSAPGTGDSTSSSRSTSGEPYRSWTTALIGSIPSHRTRKPTRRRSGADNPPIAASPATCQENHAVPLWVPGDAGGSRRAGRSGGADRAGRRGRPFTLMAPDWWPPRVTPLDTLLVSRRGTVRCCGSTACPALLPLTAARSLGRPSTACHCDGGGAWAVGRGWTAEVADPKQPGTSAVRPSAALDLDLGGFRLRDGRGQGDADLEYAVLVARLDVGLDDTVGQRQRACQAAVSQLPAHEALLLKLLLLAPLCLDVQHAVRDGKFHVPVRVDARKLGADDQFVVLPVFIDPDEL